MKEEVWEGRRLDMLLWELGKGSMWEGLKITCVDLGQCDDTWARMECYLCWILLSQYLDCHRSWCECLERFALLY